MYLAHHYPTAMLSRCSNNETKELLVYVCYSSRQKNSDINHDNDVSYIHMREEGVIQLLYEWNPDRRNIPFDIQLLEMLQFDRQIDSNENSIALCSNSNPYR